MATKKKATRKVAAKKAASAGAAPILALAIRGDVVASADGDGRVQTWWFTAGELTALATIHESAKKPITALAATETGFIGAGASLLSWSVEGKVLARAALPGVATNVVVRGDAVFVLAGGKLLSFTLPKLRASGQWKHAKGVASELDVDDARKRALVIRDNKQVELLDLVKRKSLADWTRNGRKVEAVSARFSRAGTVLSVSDDDMRLSRVKDTTGRITGEVLWLDGYSNGPIILDRARAVAAIGSGGEDVEVVELEPAWTWFYLDPKITDAGEKSLASLKRIPTFKKLAPGFFARHGSVAAPPSPSTLTAIALSDGGGKVAAGFVSGEVVVADTMSCAVVSTSRGVLGEGRCKARLATSDIIASVEVEQDLWLCRKDGRFAIFDLARHALREGVKLAFDGDLEKAIGGLEVSAETITSVSRARVMRWSRSDGALLFARELPPNKGAYLDGASVLLLPLSSLGHEGFDIVAVDPRSGESKVVVHFDRDAERFALGNDPQGWAAFGCTGTQPTITIWAGKGLTVGQMYAFDLTTGKLGRALPWAAAADGAFLARPEFSNPLEPGDAVRVTKVGSGEEVLRCPYEAGDSPHTTTAAFHADSRHVAAVVGDSEVAVWRPDARRLVLCGHRDVRTLWVRAKSLVAWDRFAIRLWDITGA